MEKRRGALSTPSGLILLKNLIRPSTELRANGNCVDNIDKLPFVLRFSKHERCFSEPRTKFYPRLLDAQFFLRLAQVTQVDILLRRRRCSFDDTILYLHLDVHFQSG